MMGEYIINIITGDRLGAGTKANVYMILHDNKGNSSDEIRHEDFFNCDHKRDTIRTMKVDGKGVTGPITKLEIWRDNFFDLECISKHLSAAWFLDRVEVVEVGHQLKDLGHKDIPITVHQSETGDCKWVFPVQRWVKPHQHYLVPLHDCQLPQNDANAKYRQLEINCKQTQYKYKDSTESVYAQVKELPQDERFSDEYDANFKLEKICLLAQTRWMEWTDKEPWHSLDDLKSVYKNSLGLPNCINVWNEDWWFALQRLQGVNCQVIELCTQIPNDLAVTDTTVKGLLDDLTLNEALKNKKIFICNLKILDGVKCKHDRKLAAPMALFFLNKENSLLPIAIQLKQQKGDDNPVFTPKDSKNTWTIAKMFYNNAEAQHHQGLTHLAYTHLLMEGVAVCTQRNLSQSHPLAKLMAPHFLFLLPINEQAIDKLLAEGGWIDNNMTAGVIGIKDLMKRGFEHWTYNRYGSVASELEARGVLDKDTLPYYPYRDDALPMYNIIKKYVRTVVEHHYDTEEKLKGDWELKNWRLELAKPRNENGVGLKEIPGSAEGFNSVEEVIDMVTMIISTSSLGHAAANFQQYEQYGYMPNYPAILRHDLPKEKREYTEEEIMKILPDKHMTLDIMVITTILAQKATNSLGDFELQYLYDPVGVKAAKEFCKNLDRLSKQIALLNVDRQYKFEWLDPVNVPNAISV